MLNQKQSILLFISAGSAMATLARASHSYRELRGMQGDSSSV